MRLSILFFMIFSCSVTAQEENSLLWEVSGNGLEKSSYLYGTMHVSKKIAFRLDDVFYEALDSSDIVALESDPDTWLESENLASNMRLSYGLGNALKGFYTYSFKVKNPRKENIGSYLAYEDRIVNGILYRTNDFSQNFEEETYLDMFIYQAGKKYDKPIVALEDIEESAALVGRASLNAMKQKPDEWLQKKMQLQNPMFLMEDAYRERNINLLDSLDNAMYTGHYLKNMLHIRNENMTKSLDSVMHLGKVFAGIGAAHLPGEKGVINLLRKKGYRVKALTSKLSYKGKKIKTQLETKVKENIYKPYSPEDGFFTINLPNKLYPFSEVGKTIYISPDLANGSFMVVDRIPTFSFLKHDVSLELSDINELLFENIPGKILEKDTITNGKFIGLDIKNELKNGDKQRYHIYKTPLEIIIFKMGGQGDYVTKYSDSIFNSISFKDFKKTKEKVTSAFKDFEVEVPSLYSFNNVSQKGNRYIEAYDEDTESYYFVHKVTINDFNFIEQDTFELKQIQKRFYQDLKLKPVYGDFNERSLSSKAVFNKKKIHLKSVLNGNSYYLLGVVTHLEDEAQLFLDSFKITKAEATIPYEKVIDTALFFSTKTTVKPPKFVENSIKHYNGAPKVKPYEKYRKNTYYQNDNNEAIAVELVKSHDLLMFRNIDSVWSLRKKLYAKKSLLILNEAKSTSEKGYHELQLTISDTASTRGILVKNIIKDGLLYEIKAGVDTITKPSRFVQEFFNNFTPLDTVIGKSILTDKTSEFFKALKTNDSLAITGYRFLKFDKKHIDSLKHYIAKHEYTKNNKEIQTYLIRKLKDINGININPFLRSFYLNSYKDSQVQTIILQTLAKNGDEASIKLMLELMEIDLPLASSKLQTNYIFRPFRDSLPLAKKLFPEVLAYSAIEEYKAPIFSLLSKLMGEKYVKQTVYKKYKKQILNDAKIQLKRQLGRDSNSGQHGNFRSTLNSKNRGVLSDYITLLFPFRAEKATSQFFNQLSLVKDPVICSKYLALKAKEDNFIPNGSIKLLVKDINSRNIVFNELKKIERLDLYPVEYKNQKDLAEPNLFEYTLYDDEKDQVVYLNKNEVILDNVKYTAFYFKKKKKNDYDKNFNMHILVYEDAKGLQTKPFYKNNGMRIEDTETEEEVMGYVTEKFLLKNRKRAVVYKPNSYNAYGYHGY